MICPACGGTGTVTRTAQLYTRAARCDTCQGDPQRVELLALRRLNAHLIDRVAAAAEVLGRVASRLPVCRCELLAAAVAVSANASESGTVTA